MTRKKKNKTETWPVVVTQAVITVRLFDHSGQPACLVDISGDLPTDEALPRALDAVHTYLARHVIGNVSCDLQTGEHYALLETEEN